MRHAQASAVRVRLSNGPGTFELRVSDNGRGITGTEAADHESIGMLGMRERAAQAGATLRIPGGAVRARWSQCGCRVGCTASAGEAQGSDRESEA